jgi:hypothetical protein
MLSVRTLERELVALKADLDQKREKVVRLTRESPTPVSTVRKTTVHVDQTPRPMAPYGYWASPSGYRYGGRWWVVVRALRWIWWAFCKFRPNCPKMSLLFSALRTGWFLQNGRAANTVWYKSTCFRIFDFAR